MFSQGKVSAVLLRKDKGFRKKVRTKLKANKKIVPLEDRDFNTNSYIITFAIIESKDRTFVNSLPFFSLVNFRLVAEELILMGYKVNVKKIRIL
ncbi:TIGR04141: sporadically distributed protein [compost metagenome]